MSEVSNDAIVYRARGMTPVVQREIQRLGHDMPQARLFVVCYRPDYNADLHSTPGKIYCYGAKDLHSLDYPQKIDQTGSADALGSPEFAFRKFSGEMTPGHHDLALMRFFLDHPSYDRYWFIEDDVRCSGSWTDIFNELGSSSADILATVLQDRLENPTWHWWQTLEMGEDRLPLERQIRGFLPFCRLSAICLRAIDSKYRQGWGGHYEVTWPSVARSSGLSIEDIGGQGFYTPTERRGRLYSCTNSTWHLFPGSFVFRPCFHDMGVSEFGRTLTPDTILWHPVKS